MSQNKGQQPTSFAQGPQVRFDSPALRGNFIPLSDGPSRREIDNHGNGLRIQVSLSESEMGKLAAVLSHDDTPTQKGHDQFKMSGTGTPRGRANGQLDENYYGSPARSRSPAKPRTPNQSSRARSRSPTKSTGTKVTLPPSKSYNQKFEFEPDFNGSPITTFFPSPIQEKNNRRSKIITPESSPRHSIAERRNCPNPPKLDTTLAKQQAKQQVLDHLGPGAVIVQCPPPENALRTGRPADLPVRHPSSVYSQDDRLPPSALISPLRSKKGMPNILGAYSSWRNSPRAPEVQTRAHLTHSKSNFELGSRDRQSSQESAITTDTELIFSPLTPYFQTEAEPGVRKGGKTLIGDDGWLEKTAQLERAKASPERKAGFFDNIVKKAKGIVDKADTRGQRRSRDAEKSRKTRSLAISFSMREQSLIYCDLEFLLSVGLNGYLTCQFNSGRLDTHKLYKVEEGWKQKGRPRVSSFHYDLETQLDLLRMHVHEFKFYGRLSSAPASIIGFIDIMKVTARAIRIRTMCQPDTVIAKQIVDAESLFNLLGVPEEMHAMLQNVRKFFREVLQAKAIKTWASSEQSSIMDTAQTWETLTEGRPQEPRISRHILAGEGDLEHEMWSEVPAYRGSSQRISEVPTTGRRSPFKSFASRKTERSTFDDYFD